MFDNMQKVLREGLAEIKEAGLYKEERIILSPQNSKIKVKCGDVINFCANNYLGLANHPKILEAAKEGLKKFGYGLSSVRFICGTQNVHKDLEEDVSKFLEKEDTILYNSCFDANGGLFETLINKDDAIISDQLNHASIIDGIRLCKAERFRYANSDMGELKKILQQTQDKRIRLIATDGVFSMDGSLAKLPEICELAEEYNAVVMVDDSHATGFIGGDGKGTPEELNCLDKVDIINSTFGKALGGAAGGFTCAKQEVVDMLRQRSRPYLFSNSMPPLVAYTSLKALELLRESGELRKVLKDNTKHFRKGINQLGFETKGDIHPITPVMLGDAKLAKGMADALLKEGIYVIGFSYPVVPKDEARIRVQISAAHSRDQIDKALSAFEKVGKEFKVL